MRSVYFLSKRSEPLPEVPWVMGDPNASFKWQVSVAGGKKKERGKRSKPKKLENVMIKITLKGKKETVKLNMLRKGVAEDINPISITSDILRALHYIKLKEITKVMAGSKVMYERRSYSEMLALLHDVEFEGADNIEIKVEAVLKPEIETRIKVKRVHKKGRPSITMGIFGKIQKERVNKLVGYLKKHLPIERLEY